MTPEETAAAEKAEREAKEKKDKEEKEARERAEREARQAKDENDDERKERKRKRREKEEDDNEDFLGEISTSLRDLKRMLMPKGSSFVDWLPAIAVGTVAGVLLGWYGWLWYKNREDY
jgi:hypothetical protein